MTSRLPQATVERFVYMVPSDQNPRITYRCDLVANNGAGWCQCVDFSTRRQPALDQGQTPGTKLTACKHLRRARLVFLNGLLAELAKQEDAPARKQPQTHRHHAA